MAQAEQVTKHCGNQCDAAMILPGKDKIRPPSSSFNHIFIIPRGLLLLLFSKIHIHYVCIIDFSKVKKHVRADFFVKNTHSGAEESKKRILSIVLMII